MCLHPNACARACEELGLITSTCKTPGATAHALSQTSGPATPRLFLLPAATPRSKHHTRQRPTTPTRFPSWFWSTCLSIVVLPEPKKPDTSVNGIYAPQHVCQRRRTTRHTRGASSGAACAPARRGSQLPTGTGRWGSRGRLGTPTTAVISCRDGSTR